MGRARDEEFWRHVDRVDTGLKCIYCRKILNGKASISRLKSHFSGARGRGVEVCKMVPSDVKLRALEAIQAANKKRKTIPSSTSNEVRSLSPQQPDNQEEINLMPVEVEPTRCEVHEQEKNIIPHTEVESSAENDSKEVSQAVIGRGIELPTKDLFGKEFQKQFDKICGLLMDDTVSSIGIYGMAGVGKTVLAKEVHNYLLKSPRPFHNICWVTVSHDGSLKKIQDAIANVLGLDLSRVEDDNHRSAMLSKALNLRKKFVLMLDDVWKYIPILKLGVHTGMNGHKLIITTRSLDVCWRMDCKEVAKLNPLSRVESWQLFLKELAMTLPKPIEEFAKSISERCWGLPLALEVMARNMKGIVDIHEWRDALDDLKRAILRQENSELFQALKLSYDNLNDAALQQCFLYCALFKDGFERDDFIEYIIDEEVVQGERRDAKFDKGHTMLNKLERVGLLNCETNRAVHMHQVVRDMAIQILKGNGEVMVRVDAELQEIPDCGKWAQKLEKVSLMDNNIREICCTSSPRCPCLSTLLLGRNQNLIRVADSFFEQLTALKILDLSCTGIKVLPSSISDLVRLKSLSLRRCSLLGQVPSLVKLKELKRLDLYLCKSVNIVPHGIDCLSNVQYLDLRGTRIEELPFGLPRASQLEVLKLNFSLLVKEEELIPLRNMETLSCRFCDIGKFNTFISTACSNLSHYSLLVREPDVVSAKVISVVDWDSEITCKFGCGDRILRFVECNIHEEENVPFLPKGISHLEICACNFKSSSLCLKGSYELKHFDISHCFGIEYLLSLSSSPSIFQSLEKLRISDLNSLCSLFAPAAPALSPPALPFSQLKEFDIQCCPRIHKLFTPGLLSNLKNLEKFSAEGCAGMEVIIATEQEHEISGNSSIQFNLPKLQVFKLRGLPKLRSICNGNIICHSLRKIELVNCEMLKRLPLSLVLVDNDHHLSPLPSLERIQVFPQEWWESVEFIHPYASNILSPLCHFKYY